MDSLPADGRLPPAPSCRFMARAALGLSIFAFIPPLGIAALVLGHMAEHRIAAIHKSSQEESADNDQPIARAALWISYLQLALLSIAVAFGWGFFHDTAEGFQRDPIVQRFFRESDKMKPLDPEGARDAESTAQNIVYQLVAINEQVRRHSEDGGYACGIYLLTQTGLEGTAAAEKRAFFDRMQESPYMYGISACDPSAHGMTTAAYVLTAVPISPRMPDNSAIFCTDQTGVVLTVRGGTSIDCFKNGQPVR
jgi:hypothetical protein